MGKGVLFCFVLSTVYGPARLCAQFTDPRTYENTAVGVNQLELTYTHIRANASLDASLIITNGRLDINGGVVDYTRTFSLLHRLAWVEASVPIAGLNGSITGTDIQRSVTSAGDSGYEFAMLLKGGPALGVAQFGSYKPVTTIGISLATTAPTGEYDPDKLLNLGSDRWSFKPEIAISHPFGRDQRWELDGYANVYFFTDNTAYSGRELLRQQALPGFEGHLSYSITPNIWVSVDSRYSFRGDTWVDGVDQNNSQVNFTVGGEMSIALNSRSSLGFEFARVLIHENGPQYTGVAVKYIHTWSRGFK